MPCREVVGEYRGSPVIAAAAWYLYWPPDCIYYRQKIDRRRITGNSRLDLTPQKNSDQRQLIAFATEQLTVRKETRISDDGANDIYPISGENIKAMTARQIDVHFSCVAFRKHISIKTLAVRGTRINTLKS